MATDPRARRLSRRLLRVDLASRSVRVEELDEDLLRDLPGGSMLAARIALDEHPPDAGTSATASMPSNGIDPFLVVAVGILAGARAPGLARCSFVARSPLTGALTEGRLVGPFGVALARAGYLAVVVNGVADEVVALVLGPGKAIRIEAAPELAGADTSIVVDLALARWGPASVAAVGPAGERGVRFATVVADRSFVASRGGVGAVMGAQRLKAIVVSAGHRAADNDHAEDRLAYDGTADPALAAIRASYASACDVNTLTRWQHDPPGFGAWVPGARPGTFAVENYRTARTKRGRPELRSLSAHLAWSEGGCPGCPTDCVKGFAVRATAADRARVAGNRDGGLDQEAIAALGPNLGIWDTRAILALVDGARRAGLDAVSTGFTLGLVAEATEGGELRPGPQGGARFGDAGGMHRLVDDIRTGDGVGDVLGGGASRAAAAFGVRPRLAMTVKGLELPVFEPRTSPGIALGYAICPTGPRYDFVEHDADFDDVAPAWPHVRELAAPLGFEPMPMIELSDRKARQTARLARLWSAFDALGVCLFAAAPTRPLGLDTVVSLVRAVTGWDVEANEVLRLGSRRLDILRAYEVRAGVGSAALDELPARFFEDPVDDGPFAGVTLDRDAFEHARAVVFEELGWSRDGRPTSASLEALQ